MLAGRTPQQKQLLSVEISKKLSELLPHTYSLSIDVRDMDPDAYKKRLLD
jgi:5-carboxymethyl-2-hydroxymuconate isomerase